MNADYKVLLDACVLANFGVCDLYLRLSESPRMLLPKWSQKILDETHRTHIKKLDWPEELADTFQESLKENFPEAMITGYDELIKLMENEKKDRHVLAAAVCEKLDLIVTFNLKDFKKEHLSPWGIKAVHPQEYLLTLYSMNPALVIKRVSQIAQKKGTDIEDVISELGKAVPLFSSKVLEDLG